MKKLNGSILIVDDDEHVLLTSHMVLKQYFGNIETLASPKILESKLKHHDYDVILLDMNFKAGITSGNEGIYWMNRILALAPHTQVILQTAYGDIELAVRSIKEGAVDFLPKPWDKEKLITTVLNAYTIATARREKLHPKSKHRELEKQGDLDDPYMIACSPAMRRVMHMAEQVAATNANILILGENGTGKELLARAIHRMSERAEEPFVVVDLGAVPATLFETEMFGHEKGAFTDAKETRMGKFEMAHGGTMFLDELGNLPLLLQVKILSVLQTKSVTRIGSNRNINLDVRLICATNADVHGLVSSGAMRQDLYYRINTVEIRVPPLRDRPEDIPLLFEHYLQAYSERYQKQLVADPSLTKQLSNYPWPGNVRQLQHAVERAVILARGKGLSIEDFQLYNNSPRTPTEENKKLNLADVEKDTIRQALIKCNGNLSRTAEELGIGRTTLYRKLEEYGISQ